jgi:signal transduction histidine kinase
VWEIPWIVGVDWIPINLAHEPLATGVIQSPKGWVIISTTIALLVLGLSKVWHLTSQIEAARQAERKRISREIHDDLGQLLTGIKMELRLIENALSKRDDRSLNPVIDQLVETAELVDATIGTVQRIATDLRSDVLDHLGLSCAMGEAAERFSKRTGIPCTLDFKVRETMVEPEVVSAAFRIFQEALTNIARHAHASDVKVECGENQGFLRLSIRDDGVGINLTEVADAASLGLLGMQERAARVGGSVGFKRLTGGGTEVLCTVPLHGKSNGEKSAG